MLTCLMDRLPSDRRSAMVLDLESGAVVTISALGDGQSGERRVRNTIGGSKGMITVEGFDFRTTIKADGIEESFREADLPAVPAPVQNLADAILGRTDVASSPEHGPHVVEVIHAAYESARTGKTILTKSPQPLEL